MTRDEFAIGYAERSGVDLAWLLTRRHVVKCDCDEDGCAGWAMVPLDFTNHRGIDGFDEDWAPLDPSSSGEETPHPHHPV